MTAHSSLPYSSPYMRTHFPLSHICGKWISTTGSPSLHIYYCGNRYWLRFIYRPDAAFTVPLQQSKRGSTFFHLYGRTLIAYDCEREILLLTDEGEYKRKYD